MEEHVGVLILDKMFQHPTWHDRASSLRAQHSQTAPGYEAGNEVLECVPWNESRILILAKTQENWTLWIFSFQGLDKEPVMLLALRH